jgi:hypothetical protein
VDLLYDEALFEQTFKVLDRSAFKSNDKLIEMQPNEIHFRSIELIPQQFVEQLMPALQELEWYLKHNKKVKFSQLEFDRDELLYQIRFMEAGKLDTQAAKVVS